MKNQKKSAWDWFSKYVRLSHSDQNGTCRCVTCGALMFWKEAQAGHFVDSRNNTVLLDERLVFPQCYSCNIGRRGNKVKYVKFMLSLGYTFDELNEFDNLKFRVRKVGKTEWEEIAISYKKKVLDLLEKKGFEL